MSHCKLLPDESECNDDAGPHPGLTIDLRTPETKRGVASMDKRFDIASPETERAEAVGQLVVSFSRRSSSSDEMILCANGCVSHATVDDFVRQEGRHCRFDNRHFKLLLYYH